MEKHLPLSIYNAQTVHLCQAMQGGGGFLGALGEALLRADEDNRALILDTWGPSIQHEYNRFLRNRV